MGAQRIHTSTLEAPEVSLVTSARLLDVEFSAWQAGIAARNVYGTTMGGVGVCDDDATIDQSDNGDIHEFKPVTGYVALGCDWMGDREMEDEWVAETNAAVDAKFPWVAGRELWSAPLSGNPSLTSTATSVSSTATSVARAVALLLARFEDAVQGVTGYIHIPQAMFADLESAMVVRRSGHRYVTANGHVAVPGPGYPINSAGPDGQPTASATQGWIFMSPPVELSAVHRHKQEPRETMWHGRTNQFLAVAKIEWIYRFETENVFAALANLPA